MLKIYTSPGDLDFISWVSTNEPPAQQIRAASSGIAEHLKLRGSELLHYRIYGELNLADELIAAASACGFDFWPQPTYVEGQPCTGSGLAGLHAITARSTGPREETVIRSQGRVCGRIITGHEAEYLYLSDIARSVNDESKNFGDSETEAVFRIIEDRLDDSGWLFSDVCRTWFYLRDILDWYDDFNSSRNRVFDRLGLFSEEAQKIIPASTGIEGRNHHGSWCTLDLLAIRSMADSKVKVNRLANPKQNEAPDYGSAFSRGLKVTTDPNNYLLVSGTASIDDDGKTIHLDDFEHQTRQTIDTVEALLNQGGAGLEDIVQATAFIKNKEDMPAYQAIIAETPLKNIPIVSMIADVCRDDLLFELDATAIVPE